MKEQARKELFSMVEFTQFRSLSKYERKVDIKKLRFIYDAVCTYAADAAVDTAALKILEVGCGDGSITLPLSRFNGTVRAFDLDEDLVAGVKRAIAEQGITNITVNRDDAYNFDAYGEKYDVIVVSEVLEHTDQPADIVAKLKTHLAPGGILIATIPNGHGPWELKNKFLKLVTLNIAKDKECGHNHVQFFTFGSFTKILNEHGLLLVGFAKSDVLSGLSYCASKNGIVAGIDLALADLLPLWMASGWYFIFKNR
jgi:2-polyprenyl-3-methyl-5-hydroxy-6-metoxy-1,4-benzoquinol methylase